MMSQETDYFGLTRLSPEVFGARGIVPAGHALFAFVLGVAFGILLRRTVAAMAVTLVALAAVLVVMPLLVRPYLLPAQENTVAITETSIQGIRGSEAGVDEIIVDKPPGAWMLGNATVDPAGTVLPAVPEAVQNCLPGPGRTGPPPINGVMACVAKTGDLGYTQRQTYHPASHFWPLQWIETGLYLALSALLTWFCFRRLRHLS